jgi:hypothetical protein
MKETQNGRFIWNVTPQLKATGIELGRNFKGGM